MIFDSTVPRISHASIRQIDSGHAEYEIFTISTILNFTYSRQSSGEKISIHTLVPELFIFRDHVDLIQNSNYRAGCHKKIFFLRIKIFAAIFLPHKIFRIEKNVQFPNQHMKTLPTKGGMCV